MAMERFGLTDKEAAIVKKAYRNKGKDFTDAEFYAEAARRFRVKPACIEGFVKGPKKAKQPVKPAPKTEVKDKD